MIALFATVLLSILQLSSSFAPLEGVTARSVKTSEDVNLSEFVSTPSSKGEKTMLVLATYAADFNAIEYAQRYVSREYVSFLKYQFRKI